MLFKILKIKYEIPISRSEVKMEVRAEPPVIFVETDKGRRFLDKRAILNAAGKR